MGLDSVELVIRLEDELGIEIPDEAAARMYTPRDVIEYVMGRVERSRAPSCVSQRGFHVVRRQLVRHLAVDRGRIRPKARLSELIPREVRKAVWPRIGTALGVGEWPALVRPYWQFVLLAYLSVAAAAVASIQTLRYYPDLGGWVSLVGVGTLIVVGEMVEQLTRPLRTEFGNGTETIGDLVRWVIAKEPRLVVDAPERWTRERVALVVRQIVVEVLGVTDFNEDSRFVEDMGMS
jgi:acyl carrier protein